VQDTDCTSRDDKANFGLNLVTLALALASILASALASRPKFWPQLGFGVWRLPQSQAFGSPLTSLSFSVFSLLESLKQLIKALHYFKGSMHRGSI